MGLQLTKALWQIGLLVNEYFGGYNFSVRPEALSQILVGKFLR